MDTHEIELKLCFYHEHEVMKLDGFDDAIIGIDVTQNRLIYSKNAIIKLLKQIMGLDGYIDCNLYFNLHMLNKYKGDNRPIWCFDCEVNGVDITADDLPF